MPGDVDRDDAYRAIGRYVVTFSELVRVMRDLASEFVAKGVTDMHLSALLLGEAPAQAVANAFFGMCSRVGELDEDERRIATALKKRVDETTKTRNDLAHGDWWIGNIALARDREAVVMPPRLVRIKPSRKDGAYEFIDLEVKQIDELSEGIEELLAFVEDFGKLALGMPTVPTAPDGPRVSRGEFRVRDVLTATKGNHGVTISRDGPRAGDVLTGIYSTLASQKGERLQPLPERPLESG